ncbi:YecA family protein [Aeromonas caviae]|uniref:YecA family protein n=1 Tax=Aeromonas caviae TaxID=648 RepID=UPI002B49FD01|nr:SEC-C domain-containing protein [Aeromonas caviae]
MEILKSETQREAVTLELRVEMERTAAKIRSLVVKMPPKELLGYIYSQRIMGVMAGSLSSLDESGSNDNINDIQFLLEYVHAVLASDRAPSEVEFHEADCVELFSLSNKLRQQAMIFAMASSVGSSNKEFGSATADIEFHAKTAWVLLRGNRHQVLEGEFYRYVLAPHDDVFNEIYGISSNDIADGFQEIADSYRLGFDRAINGMMDQYGAVQELSAQQGKPLEEVMDEWMKKNPAQINAAGLALDDMFFGGVANVSRHSKLPPALLADLAYQRGEDTDFFADNEFMGTPFRTLPSRKKPLIKLDADYYAIDPCFIRDAGYRALLFNLLQRKPDYSELFKERQKVMSEAAFYDILSEQLPNAVVYQEVYYKDPVTKHWSENDTLILIEDVLYLVEAKAGAAATISSPAVDFKRHAQSVQDLIVKAYKQCKRFFDYLYSAEEVPLYNRVNGKYEECGRIRHSNYRVMIPIGLTVESFSPFSSFCKELPIIEPLLGKHGFISMSIDDLFVLKRILPTPGQFSHYMEVRQSVASIRGVLLFDEFDHLGAYIIKNRIDQTIVDETRKNPADLVVLDGMSRVIDKFFESDSWETDKIPQQNFPDELSKMLNALDATRSQGWLLAESLIRDFGDKTRNDLAKTLLELRGKIDKYPTRYFAFSGDGKPLFVWMQGTEYDLDWQKITDKASAVALFAKVSTIDGVVVRVSTARGYETAHYFKGNAPSERTEANEHIFEDVKHMKQKKVASLSQPRGHVPVSIHTKKIGRNEPCHCGSGKKYKHCHGR